MLDKWNANESVMCDNFRRVFKKKYNFVIFFVIAHFLSSQTYNVTLLLLPLATRFREKATLPLLSNWINSGIVFICVSFCIHCTAMLAIAHRTLMKHMDISELTLNTLMDELSEYFQVTSHSKSWKQKCRTFTLYGIRIRNQNKWKSYAHRIE